MLQHKARVAALLVTIGLAACGPRLPLGMSEQEWAQLTPTQQVEARGKQTDIDRTREEERARERVATEKQRQAEQARQQARVDAAYARGNPGDIIECSLGGGEFRFMVNKWRSYEPVAFTLARSERRPVTVSAVAQRRTIDESHVGSAIFREDGQSVAFCEVSDAASPDDPRCARMAVLRSNLERGIARPIKINNLIRGATMRCESVEKRDQGKTVIIR